MHVKTPKNLLKVRSLVKQDFATTSLDAHAKELLGFTKVSTFSVLHKFSLFLEDELKVRTKEQCIIDIYYGNNEFARRVSIEEEACIGLQAFEPKVFHRLF